MQISSNKKAQDEMRCERIGIRTSMLDLGIYIRNKKQQNFKKYKSQDLILQNNYSYFEFQQNFQETKPPIKEHSKMMLVSKVIQEELGNSKIKKIILKCPWAYLSLQNNINDNVSEVPTKKKNSNEKQFLTKSKTVVSNPIPKEVWDKIVKDIRELEWYNRHCQYTKDKALCKKLGFSYEHYKKILFIQGIWQAWVLRKAFLNAIKINKEIEQRQSYLALRKSMQKVAK